MEAIANENELEDCLSRPNSQDIAAAASLGGDVLVLGAGGKMGPSLVARTIRAIRGAGRNYKVFAAVRQDKLGHLKNLGDGVEVIETDLLDPASYDGLPDAPNVVFMAGRKFGSTSDQPLTWATNAWMPGLAGHRFRSSRIVAFSTGNIYPFVDAIDSRGATEETPAAPVGEYAQSALARERMFEYCSNRNRTPVLIYRLNYAIDLRYGVLLDIGQKVFRGEPVDVTMGYVNVIWQGDANSYCLRALPLCSSPARMLNVTGPEITRVRDIAAQFGALWGKTPVITGSEARTALLSDSSLCTRLLGPPEVSVPEMIEATGRWIEAGGETLGKPTKFERRDGAF
ncbi:MAG TPA: NAD-dependent epimerase/dehydratase family protein [Bryobacteraceae bacterium]|jgi:nucleoside-diphosphate-sugar epimerase|nr:NAD-dependent epimerase/dehydratase family protein [Bryobacteraceae bacterium]